MFVFATPGCRALGFYLARTPVGVEPGLSALASAAVLPSDAR